MASEYDAAIIGGGPNGLAAAVALAREGRTVVVLEASDRVGGACRTDELTLPGFHHDVASAIHPFGAASPFFASLPLGEHGLEWVHPEVPAAHPLDGGDAAVLHRSIDETAAGLGTDDRAYRRLYQPLEDAWDEVVPMFTGPVLRIPRHPIAAARFGLAAVRSATGLARRFRGARARALLAGMCAHSIAPLTRPLTGGVGLALDLAGHHVGWPAPRGGAQRIADALASYLRSLGGEIVTGTRIDGMEDLPVARAYLFDVTPRRLAAIAGDRLGGRYRRAIERYRPGPAAFKLDWALDGPIPWTNEDVGRAGTVHLGGTFEEIAAAEQEVADGSHPDRPFVLLAQQSVFDDTRAPAGKHTGWAYCHVPNGSTVDMTERIETQVERFAPGFRDRILARSVLGPADLEAGNANLDGGDVAGGAMTVRQVLLRPALRWDPYSTPDQQLYLCSASTPPGAGVHGMCGYHAAKSALRRVLR